jgi:predicted DNA-binding mobile mystery protein A
MTVKSISQNQQQTRVKEAQKLIRSLEIPSQGWLQTMRKALGMSGAELARKLKVSRSLIAQAERNEKSSTVTIKTLTDMAQAMGCELKYAIVPADGQSAEDLIKAQAFKKARAIAARTQEHMKLEGQDLHKPALELQIKLLAERLVLQMPADFWSDN